ncbi:hypothetical protein S58_02350 [Bradyrhizobium oligotrophicum S58]|uniref:Uncharacterized protein n=1 Tax=Bradyrhizobium oligotrophicum S58 TaxID=1245469 RepID=M4Z086_9BRAD|nr:hypothetical protein S58_02350 [Bradyrhizobium oligotrophicum S58]
MLAGTLRRGSGMIGLGGTVWVVAALWPRCSEALSWAPPFGADLADGVVWAAAWLAATVSAQAVTAHAAIQADMRRPCGAAEGEMGLFNKGLFKTTS